MSYNTMSYNNPSSVGAPRQPTTQEIKQAVQQQIAVSHAQKLLKAMTDKCFKKCILKPSSTLESSEQRCLAMCSDRFIEVSQLVATTYTQRIAQETNVSGMQGL